MLISRVMCALVVSERAMRRIYGLILIKSCKRITSTLKSIPSYKMMKEGSRGAAEYAEKKGILAMTSALSAAPRELIPAEKGKGLAGKPSFLRGKVRSILQHSARKGANNPKNLPSQHMI
jgi:hypothetical protein